MEPTEPITWVAGAILLPAIGWAISVLWILRDIKRSTDKLIAMHTPGEADEAGFGTVGLQDTMREVLACLKQIVHYTKWQAEQRSGEHPPPYMEEP